MAFCKGLNLQMNKIIEKEDAENDQSKLSSPTIILGIMEAKPSREKKHSTHKKLWLKQLKNELLNFKQASKDKY